MTIDVEALATSVALVAIAAVTYVLLVSVVYRKINRLVERVGRSDYLQPVANLVKPLRRLLDIVLLGVALLGIVLGVLSLMGLNIEPTVATVQEVLASVGQWLLLHGLRIGGILLVASLISIVLRRRIPGFVGRALTRGKEGVPLEEATKRADTLAGVLSGAGVAIVFGLALFMLIAELGVNIGPMLAGLGIVGIAVGFGAQHLVRDLISGFFILMDAQYAKGDVARVAGTAGLVEDFNLRRTVLRDLDGIVHYIPNGEITTASNFTKDWSRMNLDIQVAYKESVDRVMEVINQVGEEMVQDEYFKDLLMEAPKAIRVNDFKDSGVEIKVLAQTKPIRQWEVAGEMRRRLKNRFDQEGIEIPYPHLTVYWGQNAHPTRDVLRDLERFQALRPEAAAPPPPESDAQR